MSAQESHQTREAGSLVITGTRYVINRTDSKYGTAWWLTGPKGSQWYCRPYRDPHGDVMEPISMSGSTGRPLNDKMGRKVEVTVVNGHLVRHERPRVPAAWERPFAQRLEKPNPFEMAKCATCGHGDGSHDALVGKCFGGFDARNVGRCPCAKFVRKYEKATRPNPYLMLVTNPGDGGMAACKKAWELFHKRDEFTGTTRDLGSIRGAPQYAMACGRVHEIDLGDGQRQFSRKPWLAYAPEDESLWIVSEELMNLNGAAGRRVRSITYDSGDVRASAKEDVHWKHAFSEPQPTLSPIGKASGCRAVLLDGGAYRVDQWLQD